MKKLLENKLVVGGVCIVIAAILAFLVLPGICISKRKRRYIFADCRRILQQGQRLRHKCLNK